MSSARVEATQAPEDLTLFVGLTYVFAALAPVPY